jgi:flagellar basal body-associated protein FliL
MVYSVKTMIVILSILIKVALGVAILMFLFGSEKEDK